MLEMDKNDEKKRALDVLEYLITYKGEFGF
jgi:secreted Zn-dependent insulinase-like peptidase